MLDERRSRAILRRVAAAAFGAGRPEPPGVASPPVNILCTLEVVCGVARGCPAVALIPVEVIDGPEAEVIRVGIGAAVVLVKGVGIPSALILHNALAT